MLESVAPLLEPEAPCLLLLVDVEPLWRAVLEVEAPPLASVEEPAVLFPLEPPLLLPLEPPFAPAWLEDPAPLALPLEVDPLPWAAAVEATSSAAAAAAMAIWDFIIGVSFVREARPTPANLVSFRMSKYNLLVDPDN